jgi:hypothetical protein
MGRYNDMKLKQLEKKIKKDVKSGNFRFAAHAIARCVERGIAPLDVKEAVLTGGIIEHYPEDKYGESCLICGVDQDQNILHVNCSVDPVWVITAYNPTLYPEKWENQYRKRRLS